MSKFLYVLLLALALTSCGEYQKAIKSEDIKVKYEVAEKLYEDEKYSKALRLFDQIAQSYRGKPQAEKLFYMYSMSYYKTEQYYTAGYQFESFVSNYPASQKKEEAAFLSAKSYSKLSPRYSLDQGDTERALDRMQAFIDKYPNSEYMPEANEIVKELSEKLEKKAFEIAKQYHTTAEYFGDYNAAIKTFENFLIDYPGTKYREDALYYKFDSAYELAINSVYAKMNQRLIDATAQYNALIKAFPETKYREEVDKKLAEINTQLQNISK